MIRRQGSRRQFQDHFLNLYPEFQALGVRVIKNITFVVTENCNLRCSYCYECNKNFDAIMSKETAMKAVDMLLDNEKLNGYIDSNESQGIILEFIGGEPLLEIELISFIVHYFRQQAFLLNHPWATNYMISMSSNGTLYFDDKVQKFLSENKDKLSITFTIDGDEKLHDACRIYPDGRGSHADVLAAVKHARDHYNVSTSKVTIAPENMEYIPGAIKFIHDLGITDVHANVVYENVWKDADAQRFYNILMELADYMIRERRYQYNTCSLFEEFVGDPMPDTETQNWCGGDGAMTAIGTDGRIFPCIRYMRYSLSNPDREEMEIGNIEDGIEPADTNKWRIMLDGITRQSQSTEECLNCQVASGCAWCTAYNYDVFGTPNKRATFICKLHKARVLANYYYWNMLYQLEGEDKTFKLNLPQEDIDYITQGDMKWNVVTDYVKSKRASQKQT